MLVDKYNFFLDEMIVWHNRVTKPKFAAQGYTPGNWPLSYV
jgi:hypothetical protein